MPRQKHAHHGLKLIREPKTGKKANMLPSTALLWEGYLSVMWCKCVQTVDSHEVPMFLVILPPALCRNARQIMEASLFVAKSYTVLPLNHMCYFTMTTSLMVNQRTKLISAPYRPFSCCSLSLCAHVKELKPAISNFVAYLPMSSIF